MKLSKFIFRTIRSFFSRKTPYFAHYCVTQRCNMTCHYCKIWQVHPPEVDINTSKKIIDRLDKLGIAILSFTGGEPLLMNTIYDCINYAKSKGLFVRITSNGTMPQKSYEKLLNTNINAISISLDGIKGNDSPMSKVGKKILKTIDYIYKNKGKKIFSISTVLHSRNKKNVEEILKYINQKYPDLGVFVQPVVVGIGDLRVKTEKKVNPRFLRKHSKNLLNPDFFLKACEEYYHKKNFNWKCNGGEQFFDIKPNGNFWICQDFKTKLNILDKDFFEKFNNKEIDFTQRNNCAGCTYSCYYITQNSFNPKNMFSGFKKLLKYRKMY